MFQIESPHLIAEIGVNYEGSVERARRLIESAWRAGASSVKLQHYRPESLASPEARSYWDTNREPHRNQIELFSLGYGFNLQQLANLRDFRHSLSGLSFGLSVFDHREVEPLSSVVDYFKVASGDITYRSLIQNMSATGKPVIISTGASLIDEVQEAVSWAQEADVSELVLLQCTLAYPTRLEDANLDSIKLLLSTFPALTVGVSDHISSNNLERFSIAFALGARVFEKHFSDQPGEPGNDHYHSFGEHDFASMIDRLNLASKLLGSGAFMLQVEEAAREGARRSCYYQRDLEEGHPLADGDILFLRPGNGVPPKMGLDLRGSVLARRVKARTRVRDEDFL